MPYEYIQQGEEIIPVYVPDAPAAAPAPAPAPAVPNLADPIVLPDPGANVVPGAAPENLPNYGGLSQQEVHNFLDWRATQTNPTGFGTLGQAEQGSRYDPEDIQFAVDQINRQRDLYENWGKPDQNTIWMGSRPSLTALAPWENPNWRTLEAYRTAANEAQRIDVANTPTGFALGPGSPSTPSGEALNPLYAHLMGNVDPVTMQRALNILEKGPGYYTQGGGRNDPAAMAIAAQLSGKALPKEVLDKIITPYTPPEGIAALSGAQRPQSAALPPTSATAGATFTGTPQERLQQFEAAYQSLLSKPDAQAGDILSFINDARKDPTIKNVIDQLESQGKFSTSTFQRLADIGNVKDYAGKEYNPLTITRLAAQIAPLIDTSNVRGAVFGTKGESIGFNYNEAKALLGKEPTAAEQVVLDMARYLAQKGITDVSQLGTASELKEIGKVQHQVAIDEAGNYYLMPLDDNEAPIRMTPEQVAQIRKVKQEVADELGFTSEIEKLIYDEPIKGTGLDKLRPTGGMFSRLRPTGNLNDPFQFGVTYTGKGGTGYNIAYDPTTGKPVISTSGFSTSDLDGPARVALGLGLSLFGAPMVGSLLGNIGVTGLANTVLSQGIMSGIGAELGGGSFGKGFGAGALGAGVGSLVGSALPAGMDQAVRQSIANTAGSAARTGVMGGDAKDVLLGGIADAGLNMALGTVKDVLDLTPRQMNMLSGIVVPLAMNGKIGFPDIMRLGMQFAQQANRQQDGRQRTGRQERATPYSR